ncbi:sodium-coupled monocarboxylate transporter 1-like [Ylistrum balloti]|uniref:sodium-coupled monocarboxylate transporter 1-like n=1 Tax=Ylistrum balloti TaxID=509963 RepID=UPI002905D9A9|nr:sodium-coupled monocarboxylate transporter 1-like [Ylistrum balloti]
MAFLKMEDYIILVITLGVTLCVGLYNSFKGGRRKTTTEYLVGSRNMSVLPVALSLMVSYESGIMMLGVPAEVYIYGMQWFLSNIGHFFADLLNLYIFVPPLKKLQITSIYEYLELRYRSHGIRMFATVLGICSMVCMIIFYTLNYMGSVLFVPAVTLKAVTNIPMWMSIVGLMAVVMIYTLLGGFKAVVWTDVVQAGLMIGGMLAVVIKGTIESGGFVQTWNSVYQNGRVNLFEFDPDPTLRQSFWSLIFGSAMVEFGLPFAQTTFQRIKATPTIRSAQRMYLVTNFAFVFITLLAALEGAVMFAYYNAKGCDPFVAKQVTNQNQLIAKMVTDIFDKVPCLPGLFLAALFSASLSTMSSILNSISAIFWEDIIKPHMKPMSDLRATIITRCSVLAFGAVGIFVAFVVSGLTGPISQILATTGSCLNGAVTGIFLLGWCCPRANKMGALIGGSLCVLIIGWISFGKYASSGVRISAELPPAATDRCVLVNDYYSGNTTFAVDTNSSSLFDVDMITEKPGYTSGPHGIDVLYSLSYKWLGATGILIVIVTGSVVSRFSASEPVDPSLVICLCDLVCCFIPKSVRARLRCDTKSTDRNNDVATGLRMSNEELATCKRNSEEDDPSELTCMSEKPAAIRTSTT